MSSAISTLKLHVNKREVTFVVPLYITALVVIVSLLISFIFFRIGSTPGSPEWVENSRNNMGMVWALAGFLVYLGVQSVATTFPFALTLGSTRKAFTTGTFLWMAVTSAYLSALYAALLMLEKLTNQWFGSTYIFDVYVLGGGHFGRLLAIVFLGSLSMMVIGGAFGAVWVRFGTKGPVALGVGLTLVLLLAFALVIPSLGEIFAAFELWWLAIAAGIAIVLSWIGTWLPLRTATVR